MKNVTKMILLAVAIMIEVAVISVVVVSIHSWRASADDAITEFSDIVTSVGNEVEVLNGKTVTGTELRELVSKYYDRLVILVTTKDYPMGFYDVATISDDNSVYFISDKMKMSCKVMHNANDAVLGLMFTQVGVKEAEFDINYAEGKQSVNTLDQSVTLLQYGMRYDLRKRSSLFYQLAKYQLSSGTAEYKDVTSIESVINSQQESIRSGQVKKQQLEEELAHLYKKLEEIGGE